MKIETMLNLMIDKLAANPDVEDEDATVFSVIVDGADKVRLFYGNSSSELIEVGTEKGE